MAIERKFVNEAVKKVKIHKYIHGQLDRVGIGKLEVKRTPLGTRVIIAATKPGLVIGRKGENIHALTESLKSKYKLDNPQIEVQEVDNPEFNPAIMAKQLASTLERGIHFRRAAYRMIQTIMDKGALGVQIEISGKLSGERARCEKFKKGYIKHCGETANIYVKEATTQASMKPGIVGIKIKITPPTEHRFNELQVKEAEAVVSVGSEKEVVEEKVEKKPEAKKPVEKKEEKKEKKKSVKKTTKRKTTTKKKAKPKKRTKSKSKS